MPLPRERTQLPSSSWPVRAGSRAATNSSTTGRRRGIGSCGDLASCAWEHGGETTGVFYDGFRKKGITSRSCQTLTLPCHHLQDATRACASVELRTQNRVMLLKRQLLCQGDSPPKSRD